MKDFDSRSCYNCKHFEATDLHNDNVKVTCKRFKNEKPGDKICTGYVPLPDTEGEDDDDDHYHPIDNWRDYLFEKSLTQ